MKKKQEDNLKRLLTQLTAEMRQKYSISQLDGQQFHENVKEDVNTNNDLEKSAAVSCEIWSETQGKFIRQYGQI